MKEAIWILVSAVMIGIATFVVRRYRCNQCNKWFSLRFHNDWHNGGGLGPAGWTKKEWCRHCHHHTSRVILENGEVLEDQARTEHDPWWINTRV